MITMVIYFPPKKHCPRIFRYGGKMGGMSDPLDGVLISFLSQMFQVLENGWSIGCFPQFRNKP